MHQETRRKIRLKLQDSWKVGIRVFGNVKTNNFKMKLQLEMQQLHCTTQQLGSRLQKEKQRVKLQSNAKKNLKHKSKKGHNTISKHKECKVIARAYKRRREGRRECGANGGAFESIR